MTTPPHTQSDAYNSSEGDFPILVANTPITPRERRIALGFIALLSAAAVIVAPVASVQLGRFNAFVPALQTSLCGFEFTTALLLFSQYVLRSQYALLALASGYIASGSFAFLHSLTFPGAYAPTGLFGGPDTGAWLYCLWHIGFPLSVITYTVLRRGNGGEVRDRSPHRTIGFVAASTVAAVAAITWIVSVSTSFLPALYAADLRTQTPFTSYLTGSILLLNVVALLLMIRRARTILDLWLVVALFAALPDLLLPTVLPAPRFSVAWYVARGYALITSAAILSLLLVEMMALYQRLASSVSLTRRERVNRMMSLDIATNAIIHEMRQPLAAIISTGEAGSLFLEQQPPDIEEAQADLQSVVTLAHHANDILKSIRSIFQNKVHPALISIEEIAEMVLRLVQHDLQANNVFVQRNYASVRFSVSGDPMQLQQVVLNLVKNAIDAMGAQAAPTKRLQITTSHHHGNTVILQIDDSGPGIPDKARDRVFDPFFTTKPNGMGLGLSICRQIVRAHGGSLVLAKSGRLGSSFQIELPIAGTMPE